MLGLVSSMIDSNGKIVPIRSTTEVQKELPTVDDVGDRIFRGGRIEVQFSKENGLKVDIDDVRELEVREVVLVIKEDVAEARLRLYRRHGNVGEYQDFFVTSPVTYLTLKNDPEVEV